MDNKRSISVMIVDDELFFRGLLRDILTRAGFAVVAEANNGADAVEMFRQHSPDVVLMDIYMPGRNGIESTRDIVAMNREAKILICSGVGFDQDLDAAMQAGAKGVIYKPFYEEEVVDTIRKALL